MLKHVLIANRGEIAIRIARAARALGIESCGIHAPGETGALHTQFMDRVVELPSPATGTTAVDAYLNVEGVVQLAHEQGCDCIHPGYGFLSESAALAQACQDRGLKFIGPSVACLEIFGDKIAARKLAQSLDIPVVPGSDAELRDVREAEQLAASIGLPIMLKAAGGGGGRGMRVIKDPGELVTEFERCASEAESAFGKPELFLERCVADVRHVEVQIVGDGSGAAVHFFERDCSVQQRHQKVIEIAPAPNLPTDLREKLLAAACRLAETVNYENAGTVEFLVQPESGNFYFIECNPRIQVEHTVTEEVMGVELVELQFQIAAGASLDELGIGEQSKIGGPRGFSIQCRVVARNEGTIQGYREPTGPGIRVDACAFSGGVVSAEFDPLIAKVVATSSANRSFEQAAARASAAISEYQISGIETNIAQLRTILEHPDFRAGRTPTSFLSDRPNLDSVSKSDGRVVQFLEAASSNGTVDVEAVPPTSKYPSLAVSQDQHAIVCPMASKVVDVRAAAGELVAAGQTVLVVNAMKMETHITAPRTGSIAAIQPVQEGDRLEAGQVIAVLDVVEEAADAATRTKRGHDGWIPVLDQVDTLKGLALERLAGDSEDPGVVRQRSRGKLTCRERIELLLDEDTFHEVGSVAGFASYDEEGNVLAFTPANHVGGWGLIEERTAIVCADDFTSRGGHSDGAIGAKSSHLDRLSIEMRAPSIRLLDGSSGGGSVASMVPQQKKTGESAAKESSGAIKAGRPRVAGGGGSFLPGHLGSAMYTEQLGTVPVVNMLLGSVVGIGAAKAVLGHFSVMVREIAQLFVAGPPVVAHAMGYDITKEELGDWRIHCANGSVDNLAETEQEAAAMVRQFLSYLPASVYEAPPLVTASDSPTRREEELLHIIPRKRTTTFDVRRVIELIVDNDSFFEIGERWGADQVTGFARLDGHPIGVIASDSQHVNGGALTADGCSKLTRHLDLCDLFHVPVLNLVDNPGFAVGLEHEIAGTIRRGGEWMVAFSQVQVPIFTVVMRRSFGVAGNNYATPRAVPSMRVAWPAADVGGIPPEGGIEAAYKRQLAEAKDPAALRAELNARIESARGPLGPLSRFQIEELIDPRDTRRFVCEWINLAYRVVTQPDCLGKRAIGFRP